MDKSDNGRYTTVHNEDTVPDKVAKYLDQVNDSEQDCQHDTTSEHCTETCEVGSGDMVLKIGNIRQENAEIMSRVDSEVWRVKARVSDADLDCANLGCTFYRPCYREAGQGPYETAGCSKESTMEYMNKFRDLAHKMQCPEYHTKCGIIAQEVPVKKNP